MATICPITGEMYFRPKKIVNDPRYKIFTGTPFSVQEQGKELVNRGWTFYIVDQNCGACYFIPKVITIPLWIFKQESVTRNLQKHDEHYSIESHLAYKTWYVCHEMAHALCPQDKAHGPEFMDTLIRITPSPSIHYELGYKPKNAKAAGITAPSIDLAKELGF